MRSCWLPIAFDEAGRVIGANVPLDLLELNAQVQRSYIAPAVQEILRSNNRAQPRNYEGIHEIKPEFLQLLNLSAGRNAEQAIKGVRGSPR